MKSSWWKKADKLGGAVNNMPMGSPLQAPWEDRQPTNLAEKDRRCDRQQQHHRAAELPHGQTGRPARRVQGHRATANGEQTFDIGSVVLATGWCRWLKSIWKAWAWA